MPQPNPGNAGVRNRSVLFARFAPCTSRVPRLACLQAIPPAELLRVRSGQTLPRPSTSNTILTAWFQSLSPYLHARVSPPLSTRGSVFRWEMPAVAKASGGGTVLPHL